MNTPLVSIITPVYNAEKFIEETIDSVLNQTYSNWEMILINDQSPDNSKDIILSMAKQDSRIRLIDLDENSGAAIARNKGIDASNGQFIAFLDSDDLWHPQKLEKQIEFLLQNDYAFSFTSYELMEENGTKTGKTVNVPSKMEYEDLLRNTIIGCLTVILDKNKIGEIKMVDIRTRQDFVLWLNILKRGFTAYGLNEPLAYYRKVEGSISSNKVKAAKRNWQVYREIEKLSFFKSVRVFLGYAYNGWKKS
ncbi:glycosyltransferase family 2 protein [Rossellomorea aquimaris]|uniref:Teichuronic acid biosynthesis glycosyltransferase TuaG n=1 Tax=Rossellomorea aquimaris TaxID=189382 RepID=A0A366EK28_9BACI|nr:glycosyltransferase family 2 protein [Rossellomorea aquimaris]RBP02777.1 teichuronic acid biosynthesis glycosyltransferase TuaG [Rossellomorea aquimaris]